MAKYITSVALEPIALDLISRAAGLARQSRSAFLEAAGVKEAHATIRAKEAAALARALEPSEQSEEPEP